MNINRRSFIAGLGAAIVAAKLPATVSLADASMPAPVFVLPPNPDGWILTARHLFNCIKAIGEQLAPYEKAALSAATKTTIAEAIDEALWHIRPAGLLILIEAPIQALIDGKFQLLETSPGMVTIKSWKPVA